MLGLGLFYLSIFFVIGQYHQRVLKVQSGSRLFLACGGTMIIGFLGGLVFPEDLGESVFYLMSGVSLGLGGFHLANTLLVKG